MKQKDDLGKPVKPKTVLPAPRKRFRLEKLEERIAPTPHLNPHSKLVGGGNGGGGSISGSSVVTSGGGY